MKINYYLVKDVIHGRPIVDTLEVNIEQLEKDSHPDELKTQARSCFLDIQIEDDHPIDENQEIQDLSEILDISIDTMEEIVTDQRPRLDDYIEYLFLLFKSIGKHPTEEEEKKEFQVGMKIYDNVVISIHMGIPIPLARLFRSFNRNPLVLVQGGVTYLTTRYLDLLIDPTFKVLELWRNLSEGIEREILEDPESENLDSLIALRQSLFDLTPILRADREVVNGMKSKNVPLFINEFIPNELDDHLRHLLDEADILRLIISDLMNIYYSSESSRLNRILARFTFLTSLLLLPSLIASIFGMNNVGFPGLSFYGAIGIMLVSMFGLFVFFKKRNLI